MKILRIQYKKKNSGFILIVCFFFLLAFLQLILSKSYQSIAILKKIERQKISDQELYTFLHQEAQALNTIAAYNQTIETIANRLALIEYMVASIILCIVSTGPFLGGQCSRLLGKIMPRLKAFYEKIDKLVKKTIEEQDQIALWYGQHRCEQNIKKFLLFTKTSYSLHPKLLYPSQKCSTKSDQKKVLIRKNKESISGGKISSCKTLTEKNIERVHQIGKQANFSEHIRYSKIIVTYKNTDDFHFVPIENIKKLSDLPKKILTGAKTYGFYKASLTRCESVRSLQHRFPLLSFMLISIPGPYDFSTLHESSYRSLIYLKSWKKYQWDQLIQLPTHQKKPSNHFLSAWTLSQASIERLDLMKMEFKPKIEAIHLSPELYKSIEKDPITKTWTQIYKLPSEETFEKKYIH
ncbi:MAG: hypothetical protein KDD52_04610 [Bdellovibrionales bacterium]|nr:hypothetical protein [Bdellovibrionales bacterium]